jgi:hypothetical protein
MAQIFLNTVQKYGTIADKIYAEVYATLKEQ